MTAPIALSVIPQWQGAFFFNYCSRTSDPCAESKAHPDDANQDSFVPGIGMQPQLTARVASLTVDVPVGRVPVAGRAPSRLTLAFGPLFHFRCSSGQLSALEHDEVDDEPDDSAHADEEDA